MKIKCNSDKIRYTGRWHIGELAASSTANGNYFEFMYSGEYAVICFDTSYTRTPFPHIYISVDDGANIEVSLDRYIRISTKDGIHRVCVIMKSSVESQHRWHTPIEAKVSLLEIEADDFLDLPTDVRPTIEFIGDSITEGMLIDVGFSNYGDRDDVIYWNDSTAGYAWLTAKMLNFRPIIMGYGCLGITRGGKGGVPPVEESYTFYSSGYPMPSQQPDYIVINHGTNDRGSDKKLFVQKYYDFLCVVRNRNPNAKIISLSPFSGCLAKEILEAVEKYNQSRKDNVFFIDASGWIAPEPLHPSRYGHKIISERLSRIIKEYLM